MVKRGLSEAQMTRFLAVLHARNARVHEENLSSLAKELGIAQPSLWQIVNGKSKPSRSTVERLADLEGMSVESLLTDPRERAAELVREAATIGVMGLDPVRAERAIALVMAEPAEVERPVLIWVERIRAAAVMLGA